MRERASHWRAVRDDIHRDVLAHGLDSRRGTIVQAYGSQQVDAALLLMPLSTREADGV